MNKIFKKVNLIILSVLFFVFMALGIVCFNNLFRGKAADISPTLKDNYLLNETITIPEYEIVIDGEPVLPTEYSVIYPSGLVLDGRTHTLNETGYYTVKYGAMKDGRIIVERDSFYVAKPLYSVANLKKSSAVYGAHHTAPTVEGVKASIASQDSLKFNKIIDVSQATKTDVLFEFFLTPESKGTADANEVVFRLTDIYDENNYVDFIYRSLSTSSGAWADKQTYMVVQAAGRPTMGTARHIGDSFGYPTYQSMLGDDPYGRAPGVDRYRIMMDYKDKTIWNPALNLYSGEPNNFVADLDNNSYFEKPWDGFITGEVYLSVFGRSYQAPTMNLMITKVLGYDLTNNSFEDIGAPVITIDTKGNEEIPQGIKEIPYPLFEANAVDAYDGKLEVKVNVYYNYGTVGQVSVNVKEGAFYPEIPGTYVIEYTATDRSGNTTVKSIPVNIQNGGNELDFELLNKTEECLAGKEVIAFTSVDVTNAKGVVSIEATATLDGETIRLDDYAFTPMKMGDYQVNVVVKDHVETISKTFTIKVERNPFVQFLDDIVLPRYFIKGQTYQLPELFAYDFSGGSAKKIDTKIFVKQDSDEEKEVSGDLKISANNNVTILYRGENVNGHREKEYQVPVVSPYKNDLFALENYFIITEGNAIVNVTDDELRFITNENSSIRFANSVQAERFVTEIEWSKDAAKKDALGRVSIYLTDSVDETQKIKVSYFWGADSPYFCINDGDGISIPLGSSLSQDLISLNYNNQTKQVYPNLGKMITVNETVNGTAFNGFTSNKVYVEYVLEDVTAETELSVYRINNQNLFLFDFDFQGAEIFTKPFSGDVGLGEKITLSAAHAYDVLSSSATLNLRVVGPDMQVLRAADGTLLDGTCDPGQTYTIEATMYGVYQVIFTSVDGNGQTVTYTYGFTCKDTVDPIIQVDTKVAYAKVGETIMVRNYKVFDNESAEDDIVVYVCVMNPDYQIAKVKDDAFQATQSGTYRVYYYIYDKQNNVAIESYDIIVR